MRIEKDLLGDVIIPKVAPYGAQTQRAIDLYPISSGKPLSAYPELVVNLLNVKKAAVLTNISTGELSREHGLALLSAIEELLTNLPEVIESYFPVHALHGGGGISSNMNVNEVIANLANQRAFGVAFGGYAPLHPNDHVNLNHSTSDVLNTAGHLAILDTWKGLHECIDNLESTFQNLADNFRTAKKIARTCLQDAVEISFGDLFDGYNVSIKRSHRVLQQDMQSLNTINIGGNIIGRRGDCSDAFFESIVSNLKSVTENTQLERTDNLFDYSQNHDDMIRFASNLEQLALTLIKIAKDLRLMASGPSTGLGEIFLPAVQQGSSAMPGKINPTIPEFLIQSCIQVSGYCHSVRMTHAHGELDYNPWQSIVITNLLDSMSTMENAIEVFIEHCLAGIGVNTERNTHNLESIIPTMVNIMQEKGYRFAADLYKDCYGDLERIREYMNNL